MQAIDKYTSRLSKLNTDRGRHRWSALTVHRAPHKPFLLLSVLDLFAQGAIKSNFIAPGYDLVDMFNRYWQTVMPIGTTTSMAYPNKAFPKTGYVDIAVMINRDGQVTPFIFIETKRRGHSMDDALKQVKSYMHHCPDCRYGAVTDGDVFRAIDRECESSNMDKRNKPNENRNKTETK